MGSWNFFEAAGLRSREIKHSDFISFLLDPSKPHGLEDRFLAAFLREAAKATGTPELRGLPGLPGTRVRREDDDRDIVLEGPVRSWVVVIENKTDAEEHAEQLPRYYTRTEQEFQASKRFYLYLSPRRATPSHPAFKPVTYQAIMAAAEDVLAQGAPSRDTDVALNHYLMLIRRNLMKDEKTRNLIRSIRRAHPAAIALLVQEQADRRNEAVELVSELIKAAEELDLDEVTPETRRPIWDAMVKFAPRAWDKWNRGRQVDWTDSKRLVLFEFYIGPNEGVYPWLLVGRGTDPLRPKIIEAATKKGPPLRVGRADPEWQGIFDAGPWISPDEFSNHDWDQVDQRIRSEFQKFRTITLPDVIRAVDECFRAANAQAGPK